MLTHPHGTSAQGNPCPAHSAAAGVLHLRRPGASPLALTLEERVVALEDENAALKEALGLKQDFPAEWGLTPMQARILGILCRTSVVPMERFMVALYAASNDPPSPSTVTTQICKMRPKLKRVGVTIQSRKAGAWGYWIPEDQKRLLGA